MRRLKQLILERGTPGHLTLAMVVLIAGCDPLEGLNLEGSCLMCMQPSAPVAFAVSPEGANILQRDTVTLSAWRCPTGSCFIGDPVVSDWTIMGDAVAPANASASLSATSQALLRAAALGEAMVTAVASDDATKQMTVRINVADSSAITAIGMNTCCDGKDTVIAYGDVISALLDQEGRRYRAQPTQWSVSDPTMITLGTNSRFGPTSRTIRVHKAGTVEIRAAFLNVEGRLQLYVRP
jgi:hypothetical protein